MTLHPWWATLGPEIERVEDLTPALGRELASLAAQGSLPGITLIGLRQSTEMGYAVVALDIEVERPQDLSYDIRGTEPIAVAVPFAAGPPSVISLRPDFPDTPHQNWSPPGGPCALCIDDRPWVEAQLTSSGRDIARRIQLWLAKAARGDLHDMAQPPDPLFFGSHLSLILPASALVQGPDSVELVGMMRPDNDRLIIAQPARGDDAHPPMFTVLAFQAQPQEMSRLRHAPMSLAALAEELTPRGINLVEELKSRLKAWSGLAAKDVRRLSTRLAIVVAFPVTAGETATANDMRAFLTFDTAGEIGVALGVLHVNSSNVGDKRGYMLAFQEQPVRAEPLRIEPVQVHLSLNRDLSAAIAGRGAPDKRRAVLIGAGSFGSQLSVDLAREGAFSWTVVDDDYVLPHNLVRHALYAEDIGAPKAEALAYRLSGLLGEPVAAIASNILTPNEEIAPELATAIRDAEVIIDASASVAVSRSLSDMPDAKARRICAFFNPAGTALTLLVEDVGRAVTLRDLEAQYHRLILDERSLAGHLTVDGPGVRYSGSCRSLTNRIPASNAAILSALAAKGVISAIAGDGGASVTIWTLSDTGEVVRIHRQGTGVRQFSGCGWTVHYDVGLLDDLAAMRRAGLPNETGGVLLGIVDVSRQAIHIAHALPAPQDSHASQAAFERGVVGLAEHVNAATAVTMHQVRYIGEWHSHPEWASASPSETDFAQLLWLGRELEVEGLPGLIAITGTDSEFTFSIIGVESVARERSREP